MLFTRKCLPSTKISIFDHYQLVKYLNTLSRKLLALPFCFGHLAFPFVLLPCYIITCSTNDISISKLLKVFLIFISISLLYGEIMPKYKNIVRIMLSKENSFIPLKPLFMYFSFKVIYRMFLYFRKCLEQIVCRFKTMVAEAFKNYYSIIRVYFFLVCSPFYSVDVSIFNHLFCIHLFLFARHYLNNNILDNVR